LQHRSIDNGYPRQHNGEDSNQDEHVVAGHGVADRPYNASSTAPTGEPWPKQESAVIMTPEELYAKLSQIDQALADVARKQGEEMKGAFIRGKLWS
jgi:hypothetical protein